MSGMGDKETGKYHLSKEEREVLARERSCRRYFKKINKLIKTYKGVEGIFDPADNSVVYSTPELELVGKKETHRISVQVSYDLFGINETRIVESDRGTRTSRYFPLDREGIPPSVEYLEIVPGVSRLPFVCGSVADEVRAQALVDEMNHRDPRRTYSVLKMNLVKFHQDNNKLS